MFQVKLLLACLSVAISWLVTMSAEPPPLLVRGRCPIVVDGHNFKTDQFTGKWYKIGGLHNPREKAVQCTLYDYQKDAAGFKVSSKGLTHDNTSITEGNTLKQNGQNAPSFLAKFHDLEANMTVISTDFTSYACIWTCYNFEASHKTQFAWILSRENTLASSKIAACQTALKDVGVPLKHLSATKQEGCTYA